MVRTLMGLVLLVGCGGPPPGVDDAGTVARDGGGGTSAADCTTEVAPGYPRLGGAACASHLVFTVNGFAHDETNADGLVERGHGLGFLHSANLNVTMPLAAQAYTTADCIRSVVEFGAQSYESSLAYNASKRRLTVTLHRSADAAWGDFEGDYCRVRGYINVGGSVTPNYDCKRASGKFAARVEAPRCQTACGGDVKIAGSSCVVPTCATSGTCAQTYCPSGSPTCTAALPVPDGTYATAKAIGAFPQISVSFAQGKLASVRVDRQVAFSAVESNTVAFSPPKDLMRAQGGYVINENMRPDGGQALFRVNVVEQRLADGGLALRARSPSYLAESSDYLDDFEMPKVP